VAVIVQLIEHLTNDCKKAGLNLGASQPLKKWAEKNKNKVLVFLLLNEALSFNHFLNSLRESKRGLPVSVAELVERVTDKHKNKGLNLAEFVSGENCREN
jgi:hypothetical protein